MKIYFIRHGHPDYSKDCLTPLGVIQAKASAEKLVNENIKQIFSSTNGRAMETAKIAANKLSLKITPLDFMREINWGKKNEKVELFADGHPWFIADELNENLGYNLLNENWREHQFFSNNKCVDSVDFVQNSISAWIKQFGYLFLDDGRIYCDRENIDNIALYSHGGSSSAAISKILRIPFPYVCQTFFINFTSITIIELPSNPGRIISPRLVRSNDDSHISNTEITYQK